MFDNVANFLSRTEVLIGMVLLLAALIGAMIFIRSRQKDED